MPNYNKVILVGHVTRDIELRYSSNGKAVAGFGVAVNHKWKSEAGDSKEEVCFVDISAFGKQAEVIAQYFKKGQAILVEGRLKTDEWEDKQTHQKRSKLKVVLESFSFMGGRDDAVQPDAKVEPQADAKDDDDAEIPF